VEFSWTTHRSAIHLPLHLDHWAYISVSVVIEDSLGGDAFKSNSLMFLRKYVLPRTHFTVVSLDLITITRLAAGRPKHENHKNSDQVHDDRSQCP